MIDDRTPVIVGVGQAVDRVDAAAYAALSAADLAAAAVRAALADCGADVLSSVDAIAGVRTFDASFPFVPPFGIPDNFPRAVARRLGIDPAFAALGRLGGDSPIALLGQMGARIAAGETSAALIVGGEAISTVRHLTKRGETRDWAEHDAGQLDDPGVALDEMVKPYQVIHGASGAPAVYGMAENARRARLGLSKAAYAGSMGELFAQFVPVAAANPFSSAAVEPMSATELVAVTARNRLVADPYPLRLVARDQVNQGAALIMTSAGHARALGIPPEKWVYVHGAAMGVERDLIDRPDIGAAPTALKTIEAALAGKDIADIGHFDFYSCFPIAVFATAIDALGLAADDPRGLTVTGGLPFFGGPGNNYATHAIAAMVERLRARRSDCGLVFAHGGYMSKFGAAVLSTQPAGWSELPTIMPDQEPSVAVDWQPSGSGRVLTYTVIYANAAPVRAVVIGELQSGARFIAKSDEAETLAHIAANDPLGARVAVTSAADGNVFHFA